MSMSPTPAPSLPPPPAPSAPAPVQAPSPAPERPVAPAEPASRAAPVEEEEEWRDGWEEVFEDNETGELVAQQSNRLDLACKKCDKQLDNEHQFRQHMKGHMKKDSQLVKCHYCDFMTNDAAKYLSHIGDTHSPNYTCDVCGEQFSDMKKKIEHVMIIHAFTYTAQETENEG